MIPIAYFDLNISFDRNIVNHLLQTTLLEAGWRRFSETPLQKHRAATGALKDTPPRSSFWATWLRSQWIWQPATIWCLMQKRRRKILSIQKLLCLWPQRHSCSKPCQVLKSSRGKASLFCFNHLLVFFGFNFPHPSCRNMSLCRCLQQHHRCRGLFPCAKRL